MVAVEAMSLGLPILSSNLGAVGDFVSQHKLGDTFPAGDPAELATKVLSLQSHGISSELRMRSRLVYESYFTASMNYDLLMAAYSQAGARG